jgi:hypothetical protein
MKGERTWRTRGGAQRDEGKAVTPTFIFSRVQDYIFGQMPVVDSSLTM